MIKLEMSNGLERSQSGQMVLKAVYTQYMLLKGVNDKIKVKWSWKESIGYTMQKSGQMVLKGVNWVHNDKMVLKGVY